MLCVSRDTNFLLVAFYFITKAIKRKSLNGKNQRDTNEIFQRVEYGQSVETKGKLDTMSVNLTSEIVHQYCCGIGLMTALSS